MSETDPELLKRIETAEKLQSQSGSPSSFLYDPIMDDEQTSKIINQVAARVEAEGDGSYSMGRCQADWGRMKDILKDEYDIIWFSPAEMNPDAHFD